MTNPDVTVIEARSAADDKTPAAAALVSAGNTLPYVFTLQVKLANPNAPKEGETVAPGVTPTPAVVPAPATPAAAPVPGGATS